jgi:FkbM family methyltransferase
MIKKPLSRDSDFKTVELRRGPSLRQKAASLIAREWLQPFWETVVTISNHGRGYSNIRPELNGEEYFLDVWAKHMKEQSGPPIVFDVGANEGDFAHMLLQRCAARVYSFEPNPATASRLRKRFESCNGAVMVNNIALGDETGSMLLYDESGRTGTGRATAVGEVFSDVYRQEAKQFEVHVATLDEFVSEHSIKKIHLLKIDTEGYEYPILDGAKNSLESGIVDWIQFEFNIHNAMKGHSFYKFFKLLHGFQLYRMLPHALYPVAQGNPDPRYRSINEVYKYANFVAYRCEQ